jgi:homoserine dehydrogenase
VCLNVALLGCGTVGSAFAALAGARHESPQVRITHALVRDRHRPRPTLDPSAERVLKGEAVFDCAPDVLVELLGGTEPARTLILEALQRRIPVVTANKTVLAAHGAELREAAAHTGTPLLYEAAVIAGVPFLGTFARRSYAADVTRLVAIANGTSNYILTRARESRCGIEPPLAEAQRLGYAEPDPSTDIDGLDAADKLVVLLQQFGSLEVVRDSIAIEGIRGIDANIIDQARQLGGTLKPVIWADWSDGLEAFVAPAFLSADHVLSSVDGAENAIVLNGSRGRLVFRGPGAGPAVTAATVMDDVLEVASGLGRATGAALTPASPAEPSSGWFISVSAASLPSPVDIADLLAAHGVFLRRTNETATTFAALTWPLPGGRVPSALRALASAGGCTVSQYRVVEHS